MTDVHTPAVRSRNMAAIKAKNTVPELKVRRILHAAGFRFRLHNKHLPGNPDIVLPKYRAVIFVHGCFWHLHSCPAFHWPSNRPEWWKQKLTANQERDSHNIELLAEAGWRVAVVWECSLKGKYRLSDSFIGHRLCEWLRSSSDAFSLCGTYPDSVVLPARD